MINDGRFLDSQRLQLVCSGGQEKKNLKIFLFNLRTIDDLTESFYLKHILGL